MSRRKEKHKKSPDSSNEKKERRPDRQPKNTQQPERSVPKNREVPGATNLPLEREDPPLVYTLPSNTYRDGPPEPPDVNHLPTEAAVQRKKRRLPSFCQLILMPMFATMSKITENLYLTSIGGMTQENFEKYQIRCVINATLEAPNLRQNGIETIRVPVDDSPNDDIEEFFDVVADKINERTLLNINICVHCVAGVSRSTSLVLAYLMKYQKMDLHSAFSFTHSRRPVVRPNNGFFRQLLNYEYKLFGKNSFCMVQLTANGVSIEVPDFFQTEHRGFIVLESMKKKSKVETGNRSPESDATEKGAPRARSPPEERRIPSSEQEKSDHKKENLLRRFVVDPNQTADGGSETPDPSAEEKGRIAAEQRTKKDEKRKR